MITRRSNVALKAEACWKQAGFYLTRESASSRLSLSASILIEGPPEEGWLESWFLPQPTGSIS
jgi:hypothetical protein